MNSRIEWIIVTTLFLGTVIGILSVVITILIMGALR